LINSGAREDGGVGRARSLSLYLEYTVERNRRVCCGILNSCFVQEESLAGKLFLIYMWISVQ
jgi:hypothetical protein